MQLTAMLPIFGQYVDNYLKCEYVIPAAELASMDGDTITQLTWYISAALQSGRRNANFQVFVKEVGATTLSAYSGTAGATVVYEGAIDPTAGTEVVILFS